MRRDCIINVKFPLLSNGVKKKEYIFLIENFSTLFYISIATNKHLQKNTMASIDKKNYESSKNCVKGVPPRPRKHRGLLTKKLLAGSNGEVYTAM